jgi:dipeptidyl aminopeptidase/acylaminoacyl peptidase
MATKLASPKRYTFEQFTAIRDYGFFAPLSFSPNGSEIAYTVNTSGQLNLWRQSTEGGFPYQLTTYSERAVRAVAWSPDGKQIAYTADQHGDEFHQVFAIPARGGQPEQLTEAAQTQHYIEGNSWSPNGRYLAYDANDRDDHTNMDVLIRDMKTGDVRRVLAGKASYAFGSWSPNGKGILVIDDKSNTNQDLYLLDPRSGKYRLLTAHNGEVKYVPGPWAADGSGFYFRTDEGREFTGLGFYNLGNDSWQWVETPKWDVEAVAGSRDGHYLAWAVNDDGYSRLYVRNLGTRKLLNLPELPRCVMSGLTFAPTGDKLAFFLMTPTHCAELFVLNLRTRALKQITHSMLGGIDERNLALPRLVRYPTHDGRKIPAWLCKPKGASASNKVPVILSIHGGPEFQERPLYIYSGIYQYWLNQGIGVLAPNIRGSTGYGKSYQKLIHRDWGGAELKDIEHAAKYLLSLDWVDSKRIAVFGASFGGFATLSAVSRLPNYWAAAVEFFGPSNLMTFVKAVPPHWQRFMDEWVGNPEIDHEMLIERSPITYVDQIKAPLFIIQGSQDARVVKAESDQIVEKLRARGVDVRYDVYEDEGHGFTKRENELKTWRDTTEFFERHLLGMGS